MIDWHFFIRNVFLPMTILLLMRLYFRLIKSSSRTETLYENKLNVEKNFDNPIQKRYLKNCIKNIVPMFVNALYILKDGTKTRMFLRFNSRIPITTYWDNFLSNSRNTDWRKSETTNFCNFSLFLISQPTSWHLLKKNSTIKLFYIIYNKTLHWYFLLTPL